MEELPSKFIRNRLASLNISNRRIKLDSLMKFLSERCKDNSFIFSSHGLMSWLNPLLCFSLQIIRHEMRQV